jgi:hypothetical protein
MRQAHRPNPAAFSWKADIMAKAARGELSAPKGGENRPERGRPHDPQRSSLIKLAHSALRVHVASTAGHVCPRDGAGNSEPLALAVTALKTAVRNKQGRLPDE